MYLLLQVDYQELGDKLAKKGKSRINSPNIFRGDARYKEGMLTKIFKKILNIDSLSTILYLRYNLTLC